jgi:hypothetical protein
LRGTIIYQRFQFSDTTGGELPGATWWITSLLLPGCRMKYRRFQFLDTTGLIHD